MLQPRVLVPVAAAFAFLGLALFIVSGRSFAFDRSLVLLFREAGDPSTPLGPAWLREAMRDVTALGSFVGLGMMTITASLTLWVCRYRHLAVGLAITVISATVVSTGLKILIGRARPDIVEHAALTFTASFPSGHAFLSAVTMLSIAGFIGLASHRDDIARLCIWLAWVMIVLIGVSRIYLGVHWPTDVIGGWCLGIAWSSLAVAVLGRRMAEADPPA
ncbi:phosphatase PAP2 family protein [Bosea sp. 124]|uniref:phosphatase PAP2 family protein n=1 Tax=Bosea sp. 124 TaxID=2135642 RepID=UPI0015E68A76|nr:phosphatase PAP2 family protein [Bosea sp. 124]